MKNYTPAPAEAEGDCPNRSAFIEKLMARRVLSRLRDEDERFQKGDSDEAKSN